MAGAHAIRHVQIRTRGLHDHCSEGLGPIDDGQVRGGPDRIGKKSQGG
jgi:hypothetical protein